MTKAEAECAIRRLCGKWAEEQGLSACASAYPSYTSFRTWLDQNGHGHYLRFWSLAGPDYDAEIWFDEEMNRTSRR
jgi:hypothetical protein